MADNPRTSCKGVRGFLFILPDNCIWNCFSNAG